MEVAKRRRWAMPYFELAFEHGPPHKKNFLFKVLCNIHFIFTKSHSFSYMHALVFQVKVHDTWYQPTVASNNKKHAKAMAATVALQSYGLLPKDEIPPVAM